MASSKVKILFLGAAIFLLTNAESKLQKHTKIPIQFLDNDNYVSLFRMEIRNLDASTSKPMSRVQPDYNTLSKADQEVEEKAFERYLKVALNLDPDLPDPWLEQRLAVIRENARPSTPTSPKSRFLRSVDTKIVKKAQTRNKFPSSKDKSSLFVHFGKHHKNEKKDASKLSKRSANNLDKGTKSVEKPRNLKMKAKKMLYRSEKAKNIAEFKRKIFKNTREAGIKRSKRAVVNSEYSSVGPHWGTPWWLGSTGEVALRVRVSGHAAVFRAEARATGHVALALGNDAVLAWLDDDGQPHILDCHLVGGVPMADYSQDYELVFGLRNHTHLVIEFKRPLDTCDPDDTIIGSDPIDVQWSLGGGDPRGSGWGGWLGLRPLQLLGPRPPPPPPPPTPGAPRLKGAEEYLRWDVMMKDVIIPENMATMFWCKVFRAPPLPRKHHVVGYSPSAGPAARHMVLHECAGPPPAERAVWERYAAGPGAYGPEMPAEWDSCLTPVAAWAIGSKGEMFPGHVGIPLGDPNGVTYYMLEIHYENPSLQKVIDNSGVTILYTSELRQHDAGIMVTGITVSALHVLPAGQKRYHSAGYCSEPCTTEMLPEEGINVVSVLLHAHSAGRKLSLRHVRNGQELPKIAEDDKYDYKNQQSKMLLEERNVQQGDALMMECTYDTSGRPRPTLGGYSSKQEMCLSFILHYPRTPLAGCYSMTPVKEFFETFGVKEFYNIDMKQVESMFMASGSLENFPELLNNFAADKNSKDMAVQGDDQGVSLLGQLVIKEPSEFRNKTFIAHLNEIPWNEPLLTKRIEDTLYKGKHMTFCRKRDDTIAVPIEISIFPNFSEVAEDPSKQCSYKSQHNGSPTSSYNAFSTLLATLIFTFSLMKC